MGTSKRHKMDEKAPILRCMFLHQYLIFKNPATPITLSKMQWADKKQKFQC